MKPLYEQMVVDKCKLLYNFDEAISNSNQFASYVFEIGFSSVELVIPC